MIVKLADIVIEIKSRYKYTFDMCKDYLIDTDEKPVFTVFATNEQIEEERAKTPQFPTPMLENTCIYKNICTELLKYDGILIHSAAISVDNKAYLFSAKSGTGKTTHMNFWLDKFKDRAFVINGDKPVLRLIDGVMYVFGTPWCGKEGIQKNIKVPLDAFYILTRSENNTIREASKKEFFMTLFSQTHHPDDKVLNDKMLENIEKIITHSKGFYLGCNKNPDACDVAYSILGY